MSVVELAGLYPGTIFAAMMIGGVLGFLGGLIAGTWVRRVS